MAWQGMNKETGRSIEGIDHIRQSVADILTTPVGSRVMRREYGSLLFELVDQPQNEATRLKMMAATVMALIQWEPRVSITEIEITNTSHGCQIDVHGEHQETGQGLTFEDVF